jgi:hypothetical protein
MKSSEEHRPYPIANDSKRGSWKECQWAMYAQKDVPPKPKSENRNKIAIRLNN